MKAKRYSLHVASEYPISGGCYVDKRVDETGEWMRYADVEVLRARLAEVETQRDALKAALVEVKSDLFYQLEAKRGPKFASEYPSIVKAREALAKLEARDGK